MDYDDAYANAAHIEGSAAFPPRWQEEAQIFRSTLGERAHLDIPYGAGERERFDLFLPETTPKGLVIFVHGGFWRMFSKSRWSGFAAGPVAAGWAVAMPSYDLCPAVRIHQITRQIAQAITAAAAMVGGEIRLTGHSAGGHLTARMLAPGLLPDTVAERVVRAIPISPLSDLAPLAHTKMNDDFCLDFAEIRKESPIHQPVPPASVSVWVGADERPAFIDQANWLGAAWSCPVRLASGLHHFNIIDGLRDAGSCLTCDLLA